MSCHDYTVGDLVSLATMAEFGPMPLYRKGQHEGSLIRCGECAVGEPAIVLDMEGLATRILTARGADGWIHPSTVALVQRRSKTD